MWSDAIAAVGQVASLLMSRLWGTRTKEQDVLEAELETAERTFRDAIRRGDSQSAAVVYQRLVRLRDKALSRRAGR